MAPEISFGEGMLYVKQGLKYKKLGRVNSGEILTIESEELSSFVKDLSGLQHGSGTFEFTIENKRWLIYKRTKNRRIKRKQFKKIFGFAEKK